MFNLKGPLTGPFFVECKTSYEDCSTILVFASGLHGNCLMVDTESLFTMDDVPFRCSKCNGILFAARCRSME
jgi:hypothetical protein